MGIKGLTQLIGDCAPSAINENEIKNYFGQWCLNFDIYDFLLNVLVTIVRKESGDRCIHEHLSVSDCCTYRGSPVDISRWRNDKVWVSF